MAVLDTIHRDEVVKGGLIDSQVQIWNEVLSSWKLDRLEGRRLKVWEVYRRQEKSGWKVGQEPQVKRNRGKGLKGPGLKCLRSGKLYSWTWYFELSGKRENSSKIIVSNESSNITISVMECIFLFITYNYTRLKCNETAKFWHSSQSFNSKNWFQNKKVKKNPIGNGAWVQNNWLRK